LDSNYYFDFTIQAIADLSIDLFAIEFNLRCFEFGFEHSSFDGG